MTSTRKTSRATSRLAEHPESLLFGLASALIMGLGQFLNKQILKGLIWLAIPLIFVGVELGTSQWGRWQDIQSGNVGVDQFARMSEDSAATDDAMENAPSMGDIFGSTEEEGTEDVSEADLYGDAGTEAEADLYGETGEEEVLSEEDLYGDTSDVNTSTQANDRYYYPDYSVNEGGTGFVFRDFGGFFTRGIWGLTSLGGVVIDQSYSGANAILSDYQTPWRSADNSIVLFGSGLVAILLLALLALFWVLGIIDAIQTYLKAKETGIREPFTVWVKRIWETLFSYIVSAPALLMVLFFTLIPFIFTFMLAFTNYAYKIKLGLHLISWVGFDTFQFLALDPAWLLIFGQIFLWTILWAFMSSFTVYGLGFINAMVVESPLVKGNKIWRGLLIIPWALPQLITLMVFRNVFDKDGLMNQFLFGTGMMENMSAFLYTIGLQGQQDSPIFWFTQPYNGNLAKAVVLMVNLWMGAPYHMMMIIGVMATIPREMYEAAEVDGATGFQRFRFITLPMVLAATVPALIMTFAFNFNNFGAVFFLTGGGPSWPYDQIPDSMRILSGSLPGQTDILISWIYKLTFTKDFEQYNVASVYSILIFLVVGAFSVYNMLKSKSFREEGGE